MHKLKSYHFKLTAVMSFFLSLLFFCNIGEICHTVDSDSTQDRFKRIAPEQAGFSSEKLAQLETYLENAGSSSLILVHDGKIFFEWGDIYKKHLVHSIRKALLNSLYGIYIEKEVIDTCATLGELGIDDIEPELTKLEKSARIIDLLKSRSGIYHPAAAESKGMEDSRPERGSHKPGEVYYYNNWDFNTLGAVFEQETDKSIYDAFYEDVARPLGMLQYKGKFSSIDVSEPDWNIPENDGFYRYEKDKSRYPAYHFRMSAHDLALYGVLYANGGNWQGKQIIPSSWIEESTKPHSYTDPSAGRAYGMLWAVEKQYGAFQHTGLGIHLLRIYPDSELVVVHRVDTEKEYNFSSNKLWPIFGIIFGAQIPE